MIITDEKWHLGKSISWAVWMPALAVLPFALRSVLPSFLRLHFTHSQIRKFVKQTIHCSDLYALLRQSIKKREETRIENGREKNTKLRDRHFCCYVDQTRPAPYSFHSVLFLSFLWWRMFLMWRVWLDSFSHFNPRRRRRNCCLPANVIYNNDVIKI